MDSTAAQVKNLPRDDKMGRSERSLKFRHVRQRRQSLYDVSGSLRHLTVENVGV